jgi:hypothetical protein
MLDHRVDANHLRTLEELGKHSLPSTPKESFQSIILGRIPELGVKKSSKDLPIDFCELLVSIWKNCLEEKYVRCRNMPCTFADICGSTNQYFYS